MFKGHFPKIIPFQTSHFSEFAEPYKDIFVIHDLLIFISNILTLTAWGSTLVVRI